MTANEEQRIMGLTEEQAREEMLALSFHGLEAERLQPLQVSELVLPLDERDALGW